MQFYMADQTDFQSSFKALEGYAVNPDEDFLAQATGNSTGARSIGATRSFIGGATMVLPEFVDQIGSSLGLTERGSINRRFLNMIDMPGLNEVYEANKGGIELIAGVGGLLLADKGVSKGLKALSASASALKGVSVLGRVSAMEEQYRRSLATARMVDKNLAARALNGVEAYTGSATVLASRFEKGQGFVISATTMTRNQAARKAVGDRIAMGVVQNALTEGVFTLGFNQNSVFFDEDFGDNLAFAALGLGIGGAVDTIVGRAALKRTFQTQQYQSIANRATDPTGVERNRLLAAHGLAQRDGAELMGIDDGFFADEATSFAIQASSSRNPALAEALGNLERNSLLSRREAQSNELMTRAFDSAQKITGRGLGLKGTSIPVSEGVEGKVIKELLAEDPASLYLSSKIGVPMEEGIEATIQTIKTTTESQIKTLRENLSNPQWLYKTDDETVEATRRQLRSMEASKADEAMVNISGVEWLPASVAKMFDKWVEPVISKAGQISETKLASGKSLGVDINLNVIGLEKGKDVSSLGFFEALTAYRLGDHLLKNSSGKIVLNQIKPNWFQIDLAAKAKAAGREVDAGAGRSLDTLIVESFAQKVDILRGMGEMTQEQMRQARIVLNLPQLSAAEVGRMGKSDHPIETLLRGAKSGDEIRKLSLDELRRKVNDARRIEDIYDSTRPQTEAIYGDTWSFLQTRSGETRKPIIAMKKPYKPFEWTRMGLGDRQTFRKTNQFREMIETDPRAELAAKIAVGVASSPDYRLVSNPNALADASLSGVFGGFSAPQTRVGNLINSVVSKAQRDRENPILRAASRIAEMVKRESLSRFEAVAQPLQAPLQKINGPRNAPSRLMLNQFMTFAGGWKFRDEPLMNSGGKRVFKLDWEDAGNRDRFEAMFNRPLVEGDVLMNPKGQAIEVDELAQEVLLGIAGVAEDIRVNKNALLRAQGLGQIKRQDWYVPPPNPEGKIIGFAFDATGKQIPNATIVAKDAQDYARQEARLLTDPSSPLARYKGATLRRREDVQNFSDLWEKSQMSFIDPNRTPVQPGKTNRGGLQGYEIRHSAIEDSVKWMRDSYLDYASDSLNVLFKEQIQAAKMRAKLAAPQPRTGQDSKAVRGIHDFYVENLTGRLGISSQASAVGRFYRSAEDFIDGVLEEMTPGPVRAWNALSLWAERVTPFSGTKDNKDRFNRMVQELGPNMPYKDAQEYIEAVSRTTTPPELKQLANQINSFTAGMVLRVGETMHAFMNLTGIVNSMPAVTRAMVPQLGETPQQFAQRVGFSSDVFDLGDGKAIGQINMSKIMAASFKKAWSRDSHVDYDFMQSRGYITQEVAEFNKQFGAIDSKGRLMRFLTGDKTAKSFLGQKGVVGALSILSDKSEDFSRAWAHFGGLEVAEKIGIKDLESKHQFAHELANKMIADYNPLNRPEIFQGAIGAPIGLFQSFMFNYYERMFRYVEKGDKRALAIQFATQGTLFGAVGMPGYDMLNELMFKAEDGKDSMSDTILSKFSPALGSLIYGGTLSNLPNLFGEIAQQDFDPAFSADLYSRGDANIRLPGFNAPAAFGVADKLMGAVSAGFTAFGTKNPHLTMRQLTEIAAQAMSNRPIAGLIEQVFNGGDSVDPIGQLRFESKSAMETAYRLTGLRSMRQSRELDAYYQNKGAMEIQAAKRDALNQSTRAAIRAKDFDALPDIYNKYVENGGDPQTFRRWIRGAYDAATETIAKRQLDRLMANPANWEQAGRLMEAGVDPDLEDSQPAFPMGEDPREAQKDLWTSLAPPIETPMETPMRFLPEEGEDPQMEDYNTIRGFGDQPLDPLEESDLGQGF